MKYFACSDIHGFFNEWQSALNSAGFNKKDPNHKIIICGDLLDRGFQAVKTQEFVKDLFERDKVIYIKGNHEYLINKMIKEIQKDNMIYSYHFNNGTVSTACQLTGINVSDIGWTISSSDFVAQLKNTIYIKELISKCVNYFEVANLIFVHGWIPSNKAEFNKNWRNSNKKDWEEASWHNGMKLAVELGITEPNKTIICGHWHTSYGHKWLHNDCNSEFGDGAFFEPFYDKGIIAIDGCVAHSKKINVVTFEI